jgi:beta-N-acetylhexosaminidase
MTISESAAPPVGRTLMLGLPGPRLDAALARRLRSIDPAGVILFGRNLESPEQTADLLASLSDCIAGAPLLAIDQEGGRVSRLEPWIGSTPQAVRLARGGEAEVRRFAEATGRALAALGFNLDFAPVVDLSAADAQNGIGGRSYATDPARVVELAGSFLEGLAGTGVAGCLKHFPGLGDTRVDSHLELPTVERGADALWEHDALPFRRLAERADCVMVGHGHYRAFDAPGDEPRPATCSSRIVAGWLRGRIGFDGLVASDDMEMGAVASRDQRGGAAVEALRAGCDLLLYCADLERAERAAAALERAARDDPAVARRVHEAAARVDALARRHPPAHRDAVAWRAACEELGSFA